MTKNVPCYKRCGDMMNECNKAVEKVIEAGEGDDGEEGWVDTHHTVEGAEDAAEKVKEMKLDDEDDKNRDAKEDDESDQEAVDMDDFIDSGMLEAEEGDAAAIVQACATFFQNEFTIQYHGLEVNAQEYEMFLPLVISFKYLYSIRYRVRRRICPPPRQRLPRSLPLAPTTST